MLVAYVSLLLSFENYFYMALSQHLDVIPENGILTEGVSGQSGTHIDLSETAFKKIGNTATGVLQGTWKFV